MKLTYIYHSCFALETPAYSILFDYYKDTKGKQGYVHDILLQKPEPLYILSSHFHCRHIFIRITSAGKSFPGKNKRRIFITY